MYRVIAIAIGYLLGGIQTAILYSRLNGMDIREHGSGNAGATNTLRVLGKKAAVVVFIGDVLKSVLAIVIVRYLFKEDTIVAGLYAGIGAIIGHSYPLFFKFKGGKGIAVTIGALYFIDLRVGLIATVLFLVCVFITRIVSLSSLLLTASVPISFYFLYKNQLEVLEIVLLAIVITVITAYRHKENIKRLMQGKESKLGNRNLRGGIK